MSSIAVVTARGGSKRIPKKNIRDFCGKPIIAYSIEAALESGIFDEVMVSTDSDEIAETAIKYGAKVPFKRSGNTSGDFATTEDVLFEVLAMYKAQGRMFDDVCCIYPTAPFVNAKKLRDAYMILKDDPDINSVVPVVRFSFPPQRGMVCRKGFLAYQYPENAMKRSQDLEPVFHDCGQFYFCRIKALEEYRDLICPGCVPLEMPEEEVQDIDNYSDWNMAELKFRMMNDTENKKCLE
ncbi:MAG: pseudaminic acid cytidylyltransferase [Lachnospiraceae bacterium]|nr:pseudaminic acid cytidylyltransferase [Lachnospiraceae bacterium]